MSSFGRYVTQVPVRGGVSNPNLFIIGTGHLFNGIQHFLIRKIHTVCRFKDSLLHAVPPRMAFSGIMHKKYFTFLHIGFKDLQLSGIVEAKWISGGSILSTRVKYG